jgi:GAF domain
MSGTIRLAFAKGEKRVSGAPRRARRGSTAPSPIRREPDRGAAPFGVYDGLLAVTGLSKALAGEATIEDVGALAWIVLRQVIPSDSMAVFVADEHATMLAAHFAAGLHAETLRTQRQTVGAGIAGWTFEALEPAFNIDPTPDFANAPEPALHSSLAIALVDDDWVVGVIVLYRKAANAFTDADLRLLELFAPRLASAVLDSRPAEPPQAASLPQPSHLKLVTRS